MEKNQTIYQYFCLLLFALSSHSLFKGSCAESFAESSNETQSAYAQDDDSSGFDFFREPVAKQNREKIKIERSASLFPESWDYHKINAKIKEASKNVINIIEQEGKYEKLGKTIIGKTSEGIEIEIVLKRDSIEDKWKTASAYVSQSYIKGH